MNIKEQKKEIREQYRAIRKDTDKDYREYVPQVLIKAFDLELNLTHCKIVAAYISMDGEVNVIPLMHHLRNLGYEIVIPNKNRLLKFERWQGTDDEVVPDIIITPIIAFDDSLNRLGFGSGWYDEMIQKLRPLGKTFIGVAYEKQYHQKLPTGEHDQKLDMIITEVSTRYRKKHE